MQFFHLKHVAHRASLRDPRWAKNMLKDTTTLYTLC